MMLDIYRRLLSFPRLFPQKSARHLQCAAFLPAIVLIFMPSSPTSAFDMRGVAESKLYTYNFGGQAHIRPYEVLQADLFAFRNPDGSRLAFHTYARWTSDLKNRLSSDPQLYVYHGYLQLAGFPKKTEVDVGRQYVFTEVGSSLFDGVKFRYDAPLRLRLDLFGGHRCLMSIRPSFAATVRPDCTAGH